MPDFPIEYPYGIVGIATATLALAQFTIFVMARHTLYADGTAETTTRVNDGHDKDKGNEGIGCASWVKDPVKRIQIALKLMLFLFWTLPIGECKFLKEQRKKPRVSMSVEERLQTEKKTCYYCSTE